MSDPDNLTVMAAGLVQFDTLSSSNLTLATSRTFDNLNTLPIIPPTQQYGTITNATTTISAADNILYIPGYKPTTPASGYMNTRTSFTAYNIIILILIIIIVLLIIIIVLFMVQRRKNENERRQVREIDNMLIKNFTHKKIVLHNAW